MVVQDLVRQYGRKGVKPSCLMKIDLQKAYDTVDWQFLQEMLEQLEFPQHFVNLVMQCVSTPMFSLMFNGSMHGFFKSKRGLRQDDPISPLLFVICMEYLSRLLHKMSDMPLFDFHPRCREIKLTHLCFADDLILCCKGEYPSILLLLKTFKLFSVSSGLKANQQKSSIYCHGMSDTEVQRVVDVSGFTRSNLPFKYLGVPICSKKISVAQCSHLAQIYVLPKSVLHDIGRICRAFLWSGQAYSQKPRNVAWDNTCCGKQFGGLGFRDIILWNTAAMGKYVWALTIKQDNVWIKWISSVYLKDGDWWEYKPPVAASWYWKQICKTKEHLKQFFTQSNFRGMTTYSVKQVYETIIGNKPRVHWDKVVWNRLNNPKHRFIGWLAMQPELEAVKSWLGMSTNSNNLTRNTSFWDNYVPTVNHTVNKVKQVVRGRIHAVMPKSVSKRDTLYSWLLLTPCD
ncbi:uncharacterized protein [Spinacia oleracea]|uniref:Reverse transcriptase domain-containing protein n=1 Tax=Spinacia oleracea TaxID=3562 RepID=A0ABM3RQU5_SPIOL|nr:uncharacterized protein LOC110796973 [Spinacia oleracea]